MERHTLEEGGLVDLARLLLEDACSDLVHFLHSRDDSCAFGQVRVDREYALGHPGAFAGLRVDPGGEPPYFMEVTYGFEASTLVQHMARKYAALPDHGDARSLGMLQPWRMASAAPVLRGVPELRVNGTDREPRHHAE